MKDWLIIDGYNLIYQLYPENVNVNPAKIERCRKDLLTLLEPLVNILARKITVVFDGRIEEPSNKDIESEVIDVVYSPPSMSADTIIENLVWKTDHPENILVVTSDRQERNATSASGADTIASSLFIAKLIDEQTRLSDKLKKMNKNHENITLGDFFNFPPASSD